MMSVKSNSDGSIGDTAPEAISRFDESPDADTPSHCPACVVIRLYISSELSAYFDVDLAAGLLLERRDPVVVLVALGRAVLDVADPRDQVQLALARADRRDRGPSAPPPASPPVVAPHAAATSASAAPSASHPHGNDSSSTPPPGPMDPSRAPAGASTCRLLLRSHTRRTALPRTCSASIELVARFCCMTTSAPPSSSVDDVPGDGTQVYDLRDVLRLPCTRPRRPPVHVEREHRIFSGRIVTACGRPTIAAATSPSSTFDTPTNPATNPVAGRS